jgi:hypothetical protein
MRLGVAQCLTILALGLALERLTQNGLKVTSLRTAELQFGFRILQRPYATTNGAAGSAGATGVPVPA